ncbi:MAG: amidohydrolase family protein, partial [Chloroflexi bacterium]|nr:amidohydrolase family protein [Chloroflexota bacterium]
MTTIEEAASTIPLIDHHCHGVLREMPDRAAFEILATESDWPEPGGQTIFDSPFGVVVRAECAPLLGLERHASADAYFERRSELGQTEVMRRLFGPTGIQTLVMDTGFGDTSILSPDEMSAATGASSFEIVRLERVAESIAGVTSAAGFAADFRAALGERAVTAVGFKSIIAYRFGLDFDPARPAAAEVERAAGEWLEACARQGRARMDHPVLLRHILWEAVDHRKPIQFHVGYGDSDIVLHRCDPTQMTGFIKATVDSGIQIMLLHCYPFIREAGFLAQVYPHVWLDTGAAVNYTGLSSGRLVRDSVELAPFSKVLFSSDAYGLPELYFGGAFLWRRAVGRILGEWVAEDGMGLSDARRYLAMMAGDNARRAYRIG